jgi:hypothetical protein
MSSWRESDSRQRLVGRLSRDQETVTSTGTAWPATGTLYRLPAS